MLQLTGQGQHLLADALCTKHSSNTGNTLLFPPSLESTNACRLQLSEQAQRLAEALRSKYFAEVNRIYTERAALNARAIEVLLPSDGASLLIIRFF